MSAPFQPTPFTIFCGKGGVGKTTLSLAFALWQAEQGKPVVLVTSHPLSELAVSFSLAGLKERCPQAAANLFIVHIDPRAVLNDKIKEHIPAGILQKAVLSSRIYKSLIEIVPGLKEVAFLDRLRQLVEGDPQGVADQPFDFLVWDAPATGHFLQTVNAAQDFEHYLSGPFALIGKELVHFLSDPSRHTVFPVTTLEEMAVQETVELCQKLESELRVQPAAVICNITSPLLAFPEAALQELSRSVLENGAHPQDWQFVLDRLTVERSLFENLRSTIRTEVRIVERITAWESDVDLLLGLSRQLVTAFQKPRTRSD